MSYTIIRETILTAHECGECGITWAMPKQFIESRRKDGKTFYCPNGHKRVYRETEAQKLEKKLAAAQGNYRAAVDRAERAREQTEAERRRHAATKGQLTKTKKRVAGGVCPCCNRSFVDLGRHMAGQHPDYTKQS